MANVLHADAAISCPHGGTASLQSMQTRVAASGQTVADLSGQWVITGCSFTVGGRPQPCVTVHWTTTATRVSVLGHNIVTQGSTGVCLNIEGTGQGVPIIAGVQQRVTAVQLHIARLCNPVLVRRGRVAALVAVDRPHSFPPRRRPAPLRWSSRPVMARRVKKVTPHAGRR